MKFKTKDYLYERAQKKGKKLMIVLTDKNYKNSTDYYSAMEIEKSDLSNADKIKAYIHYQENVQNYIDNLTALAHSVTTKIQQIEQKQNRKILHRNKHSVVDANKLQELVYSQDESALRKSNPCYLYDDCIYFTFNKGAISKKDFVKIVQHELTKAKLPYELWVTSGYYETDNENEKSYKLWREDAQKNIDEKSKINQLVKAINLQDEQQIN